MNYASIKKIDIANGPGLRVSLFVSGCRNHCKGCFNPETWRFDYGNLFTAEVQDDILYQLSYPYISGLSVLGGDPLEPENVADLTPFLKRVKEVYPDKTIWLYTGYLYENVKDLELMQYVDILVDGPFVETKRNPKLAFRGSENQRIIDLREKRKSDG